MNHRVEIALKIVKLAHSLGSDYDSNVIGLAGEVIAEEFLGMKKAKRQSRDIDGHIETIEGRQSVQVKTLSSLRIRKHGGTVKVRVAASKELTRLAVILIFPERGEFAILYDGLTQNVGKIEIVKGIERRGITVSELHSDSVVLSALVKRCKRDA